MHSSYARDKAGSLYLRYDLAFFFAVNELAIKIKMLRIGGVKHVLAAEEIQSVLQNA